MTHTKPFFFAVKGLILGMGILYGTTVFATVTDISGVATKAEGDRFLFSDFNSIVEIIRNLFHDNNGTTGATVGDDKIGIGTNTPASTLDIKGVGNTNATSALNVQNSDGNSVFFVSNDRTVGVGTTSPSSRLDLEQSGTAKSNTDIFEITNSGNAEDMDTTETSILFNQYYYDAVTPAVADSARITAGTEQDWTSTTTTQDSYLSFQTGLDGTLAEKMRLTSAGKLGIGTTTPESFLSIARNSGESNLLIESGGNRGMIKFRRTSGTLDSPTIVADGDRVGIIQGDAYDGTEFKQGGAIGFDVDGVPVPGQRPPSRITFYTNASNTPQAEQMRIDNAGQVGIGTSAPDRLLHAEVSDALVSSVTPTLRLSHVSTGTPEAGLGAGIEFEVETANGNNEVIGSIEGISTSVGSGTEDGALIFKTMDAGSTPAERMRITDAGYIGIGTGATVSGNLHIYQDTPTENQTLLLIGTSDDASRFSVDEDGDVGVDGTVTATAFVGDGSALTGVSSASIDANTLDWEKLTDTMQLDATTTIDMDTNSADLNFDSGTLYIDNAGYIGIGTSSPTAPLTLANNSWIASVDNAGTGIVNLFKLNSSDQIEIGGALYVPGGFGFPEDSGVVTAMDMPISSSASDGTSESYAFKIDGENILKIGALSDGAGGIDTKTVTVTGDLNVSGTTTLGGSITIDATDINVDTISEKTTDNGVTIDGLVIKDTGLASTSDTSITIDPNGAGDVIINTDDLVVDTSEGKVGIGTAVPTSTLSVQGTNSSATFGSDQVTNGAFSTDPSGDWTYSGTWSWGTTRMNYTGTTGGVASVTVDDGGTGYAVGNVLTLSAGGANATITVSAVTSGVITSATVTSAGTGYSVASGISATGGAGSGAVFSVARLADSANTLSQDVSVTASNTYEVSYKVDRSAGEVLVTLGGASGHRVNTSVTTVTQVLTASTTGNLIFTPTADFTGYIDNVSVKLITLSDSVADFANSEGTVDLEIRNGGASVYNTAVGLSALQSNTTGNYNTAIGRRALQSNTTGSFVTAIGLNAIYGNTTGSSLTAIGANSLQHNTSGESGTGLGVGALQYNTTGDGSTAVGRSSLSTNTSGNYNTTLGYYSLWGNTTGSNNTAIGTYAGRYQRTASNNIYLGYQAGDNLTTGSNNIIIGYDVDAITYNSANTLNIGNLLFGTGIDGTGTTLSSGNIGIGTTSPDRKFHTEVSDSATNSITYGQRISHITSDTPVAGIGVGIEFEQETSADNNEVGAIIEAVTTDVTATSEDFDLVFKNMSAGASASETMRITSDGWLAKGATKMFKVNSSGQIDVGAQINVGTLGLSDDSGVVNLVDMGVTSTPSAGDDESYSFSIDSNPIMTIFSEADGSGGIQNKRVGIGTITPSANLHIYQDTPSADQVLFQVGTSDSATRFSVDEDGDVVIAGDLDVQGSSSFASIAIDPGGDVGIGTASPSSILELSKDATNSILTVSSYHDTEATYPGIILRKSDNTADSPALVDDNAVLGAVRFKGYDGDEFIDGALIQSLVDGTPANNEMPAELMFYTNSGTSTVTERMRIDKNGQVGIGISTPEDVFHVAQGNQDVKALIDVYDDGAFTAALELRKSDSDTVGTKSETDDTDELGRIKFRGVDTGSNFDYGAAIYAVQDGSAGTRLPANLILESYSDSTANSNQLVLHNDGYVGIGTVTPSAYLDLEKSGTAKANLDMLELTNSVNADDMDSTETSILFNQFYYDASTPAVADAGRISIGTEQDWTSTGTTQDSYMAFETALDGTVTEYARLTSAGNFGIGTITPDRLFHTEVSDSATNTVTYGQRISHITSGTAVANFGTGIEFELESGSGNNAVVGSIESILTDATDGAEESALIFKTADIGDDGLSERARIDKDGNMKLAHNTWLRATDSAGTGNINMFRVNGSDQIEVGGPLSVPSGLSMAEDSGVVTALDMPVSSSTTDGDEMSYTYRIDGTNILKVKALADGAGGVDTPQVVVSPGSVAGSGASPMLAFGDGDTGFYESADDNFSLVVGGSQMLIGYTTGLSQGAGGSGGWSLSNTGSSATSPTFRFNTDTNTGIGTAGADQLSLIAGGVEGLRILEDTDIEIRIAKNDSWISSVDNAGTGTVNMFKVGTSDEVYVGGALNVGTIEATEDSGAVTLVNMPVSATPTDGDEMSYSFMIDADNILKVKASADSAGGVDEKQVIIAPGSIGNNASFPSLAFGDGDTGFFEILDDYVQIAQGGINKWRFTTSNSFESYATNGAALMNEISSSTNPVLTFQNDKDTGIGSAGTNQLSLISGETEGVRINTATSAVNYLDITPSATTDPILISAAGTDTNIDLKFTPKGTGIVRIPNNVWIGSTDNAGTGTVNMFRVNGSDEIDVGASFNVGTIDLAEDSGVVGLVNLPVSSSAVDGTEESYTLGIDSTAVLKVKGSSNGAGGADELQVVISDSTNGTASLPSFALGDGDTGLYETSDDNLGLSLAGALKVSITSAGNLGFAIETGATTTGEIAIDLDGGSVQNIALTGDVSSMSTTNRSATISKSVMIVFDANGGDRTFTSFNASWKWIGTAPSALLSGDKGILTLTNIGSAEKDIVASYEELN